MKPTIDDIVSMTKSKIEHCLRGGKLFSLSTEEIKKIFNVDRCIYSGRKFSRTELNNKPTFERINPWLDYVPDNVIIITKAANQEKAQLDAFVKGDVIDYAMKIKLMRKAIYQLEKRMKEKEK